MCNLFCGLYTDAFCIRRQYSVEWYDGVEGKGRGPFRRCLTERAVVWSGRNYRQLGGRY